MDLILIIVLMIFLALMNARDDKKMNRFDYTNEAKKMRQKEIAKRKRNTSKTDHYRNLY